MKLPVVFVCLSVAVMVVMIFQAVRQELELRTLKARLVQNSVDVKRKEESIVELKNKIQQLKSSLMSANAKIDEIKKKKEDIMKATDEFGKNLQTCNSEKADAEKKKTSMTEAINKLNADHKAAKKNVEDEILTLTQNILDRDKAICTFADKTKEEARALCKIHEAPK